MNKRVPNNEEQKRNPCPHAPTRAFRQPTHQMQHDAIVGRAKQPHEILSLPGVCTTFGVRLAGGLWPFGARNDG